MTKTRVIAALIMAPLAIWGAARILETTGEYVQLYYIMAALAVLALLCGLLLPGERKQAPAIVTRSEPAPQPSAQPAE